MSRKRRRGEEAETSNIDSALGALDSQDLRELIREVLGEVKDDARGRMIDRLVSRAARKGTDWAPERPNDEAVVEVLSFVEAARQTHYADPSIVDMFMRRATDAFLSKDYRVARRIFHALLPPLVECEIDLGQHEMLDEVLTVDTGQCAVQYVVSTYMTSDPDERAKAVHAAIGEAGDLGLFWKPIEEMEAVALEPLPELPAFLQEWRNLVGEMIAGGGPRGGWGSDEDCWRREVVQRLEGADGTAALAAQELGRKNLPSRLERAWREAPSLLRLRRWLGSARTKAGVRKLAAKALEACPRGDQRQLAVLHLVMGEFQSAAKSLSSAPGLGWSDPKHPGHLLFLIFAGLLSDGEPDERAARQLQPVRGLDLDEMELVSTDPDEPRLQAPEVIRILDTAGTRGPIRGQARSTMLTAMHKTAEKRLEGVTRNQRRRYYGHAAELVATCAALDPSPAGGRWVAGRRSRYSRYPALQREFNKHLGNG